MATKIDNLFDFEEEIVSFSDRNELSVLLLKEIEV